MSSLRDVIKILRKFDVTGCHIRASNVIGFSARQNDKENNDPGGFRRTAFFFFYPDETRFAQWQVVEWGLTTGVHGCGCFLPNQRWVFLSEAGDVYVVGQGLAGGENQVTRNASAHFCTVKCIAGGHAYAVGNHRAVYKRMEANKWVSLGNNTLLKDREHSGFSDIDGFAENDIYACGGRGDLWWYDGRQWKKQDCATDAGLQKIVCAPDGNVYITTNQSMLITGRTGKWRKVGIDTSNGLMQAIVCYGDHVMLCADNSLFDVTGGELITPSFGRPPMKSCTHLAAGDGILLVAGSDEAFYYDGSNWKEIFQVR